MLGILFFALVFYFNLLLISCFSRVRLCATPEMAAHQAPLSLGSSRQEHWSGLAFPSPMHESESKSEVAQSCRTLCDPMDCSLSGSSIHGIFQTRVLHLLALVKQRLGKVTPQKCVYTCRQRHGQDG